MIRDINLRRFRQEDWQAVKSLIYKTIDISYSEVYPVGAIEYFKNYHCEGNILSDATKGYTIVLECSEGIVGTGTLLGTNIRRVFIDPSCQHNGLGKLIMYDLEERALAEKVAVLGLEASLVSKQFYESLDYISREETYIPVRNEQKLSYYIMVKRINDNTT